MKSGAAARGELGHPTRRPGARVRRPSGKEAVVALYDCTPPRTATAREARRECGEKFADRVEVDEEVARGTDGSATVQRPCRAPARIGQHSDLLVHLGPELRGEAQCSPPASSITRLVDTRQLRHPLQDRAIGPHPRVGSTTSRSRAFRSRMLRPNSADERADHRGVLSQNRLCHKHYPWPALQSAD